MILKDFIDLYKKQAKAIVLLRHILESDLILDLKIIGGEILFLKETSKMKQTKPMLLEELCKTKYAEEVKTFILAYSIQLQIERMQCYGINQKHPLGVLVIEYDKAVQLLSNADMEITAVVEIYGTLKVSYVIELKTKGVKNGRGMLGVVSSNELKKLKNNYGVKKTIPINKRHITQMLLRNFNMINDLL